MLQVIGLISLVVGFASCRRFSGGWDETTDAIGVAAFQKSLRLIFLGATAFAVGFYLRGRAKGTQSVSQLRADITLFTARFCPKCRCAFHPADCAKKKQLCIIPRFVCPDCGARLEQSGTKITVIGMFLLGGYFMILLNLVFSHVPDFLEAVGLISFLTGIPVIIVGILRVGRQPKTIKLKESTQHSRTVA